MLEALDLDRKLPKDDYKSVLPHLQRRLHRLQRACWEAKVATLVVLEGWDGSGKGAVIRKITQRLEPRRFSLHTIREPRSAEKLLPWMKRYWARLPNWGEMAIFDRSWYRRVVEGRIEKSIDKQQWRTAFQDITSFERGLAEDRYLVVKFFLHISKKEQKRRFKEYEGDPENSWRVESDDWKHHKSYDKYRIAFEEMLARTESEFGPWTLVEATDLRWTRVEVFKTLVRRMEAGLAERGFAVPEDEESVVGGPVGPAAPEVDEC